jgi:spore maturation protein SpmA
MSTTHLVNAAQAAIDIRRSNQEMVILWLGSLNHCSVSQISKVTDKVVPPIHLRLSCR